MNRIAHRLRHVSPAGWLRGLGAVLLLALVWEGALYARARNVAALKGLGSFTAGPAVKRDGAPELSHYAPIMDKGHFGKKKPPPLPKLFGIVGEQALLGNDAGSAKFYEVGADLPGGRKLAEIRGNVVVIETDGRKEELKLFPALYDRVEPMPPPRPKPAAPVPEKPEPKAEQPAPAQTQPQAPQAAGGWGGAAYGRQAMWQRWQQMTPEQREQMRRRAQEAFRSGRFGSWRRGRGPRGNRPNP